MNNPHQHRRGHGFKSCKGLNLFHARLIFTTAQVVFITPKIAFMFMSSFAFHTYDFHIFTVI